MRRVAGRRALSPPSAREGAPGPPLRLGRHDRQTVRDVVRAGARRQRERKRALALPALLRIRERARRDPPSKQPTADLRELPRQTARHRGEDTVRRTRCSGKGSRTGSRKTASRSGAVTGAGTGGRSGTTTSPTPASAPESATAAAPSDAPFELDGWVCDGSNPFRHDATRSVREVRRADGSEWPAAIVLTVGNGPPKRARVELPERVLAWLLTGERPPAPPAPDRRQVPLPFENKESA